jgi:spore coat protein CotH
MHVITGEYQIRRSIPRISSLVLVLAICTFCNCMIAVADATNGEGTEQAIGIDMSDAAHSSKAEPNYEVVFPADRVNIMTITITPGDWEKMRENMTEMYGEFGEGISGGGPGQAGEPGGNPGERQKIVGMFSEVDPVYVPADVSFEGVGWQNVGIRFKGFNSLQGAWREGSYKISLKLNFDKFEDEFPEIKNQRFYGFDELNLQGNFNDDSLLREMVVPSIFRESGVPAPYTAFYRLYVDYGDGPKYFGVYTMVEAVEDTLIETQFADDSGNLYKPEGNGATFAAGTFDRDSFEKKTNEDEADWSDVETLYAVLHSDMRLSNPVKWRAELEEILDVDVFLRWLATNTVIQNWDTYGGNCRNFYLYTDPADGRITWIPWDNNYALDNGMGGGGQVPGGTNPGDPGGRNWTPGGMNPGEMEGRSRTPGEINPGDLGERNWTPGDMNETPGVGMGSTLSLGLDEVGENWPLIRYIADDPVYYTRYQEYLGIVVTTSFEPSKMEETYEYYHALIEPYVTGQYGEQAGYTHLDNPRDFDTALDDLIEHVKNRYDAVMEFLTLAPVAKPTPTPTMAGLKDLTPPTVRITTPAQSAQTAPGETLQIAWSATDNTGVEGVAIFYTLDRGKTWIQIADDLPEEGSFTWTVPKDAGSTLIVKVSAADAAGNVGSASRVCTCTSATTTAVLKGGNLIPSPIKPVSSFSDSWNIKSLQNGNTNSEFIANSPESARFLSPVTKPVTLSLQKAATFSSQSGRDSLSSGRG